MTLRWHARWGAYLWLCLAGALLLAAGLRFSNGLPLQTNFLALLPATERNPVAETAVNRLATAAGDRAIFLLGHADFATAAAAARGLATSLSASKAFAQVTATIPPFDLRQITSLYAQHQYRLLAERDQVFLNQATPDFTTRLQAKLYAPFSMGLNLPLAQDPFGFADAWLAALPLQSLKLTLEDGVLVRHMPDKHWVFVSAQLPGSAHDKDIQTHALAALAVAEKALPPDIELVRTGTVFYAAETRRQGEREFDWIGGGSLLGMLFLLYRVFRSVRPLLLGLLSVAFGIITAMLGVVLVYGELHLITLVFGASLIGEAIDYAVQYFAAHMGAGRDWQALPVLRKIAPGLCVALMTSLLGYCVLMFAPFPALRQIALFAVCGLVAAWLSVFLLLPTCLQKPSQRDPEAAVAMPRRWLAAWQQHMTRRRCSWLMASLAVLAIPGCLLLTSDDDVHQLVTRPPALYAQEMQMREITGFGNSSQFYLVEGNSPAAVLQAEEALTQRLKQAQDSGNITGWQAVSSFVPSAVRQQTNYALLRDHLFTPPGKLEALLDAVDMRPEVAQRQRVQFEQAEQRLLSVDDWLAAPLSFPFRHLWLGQTPQGYASIVMPQGIRDVVQLEALGQGLLGVTFVDKASSVSALFRNYRQWGAWWLLGALVLMLGVLKLRYTWRDAMLVLTPTLLSLVLTLSCFGLAGKALTLFNVMGLMLVLGIGVNYAIFLREGGVNAAATLAGVVLSAGTTLLSFGLLAFSSMPALSGFGLTLLIGIGIAVVLSPLSLSFSRPCVSE